MLARQYLVMRRKGQWWVTLDGARQGPYVSDHVAIASAVHSATLDFRAGQAACVTVDDPDDGIQVLYDSAAQG